MNKVVLMGRLTKEPEVRRTTEDKAVARFTVAINRRGNNEETDFINCVAFGNTAEVIEKYFSKGNRICVAGRIRTDSYTNKDGAKVYTTDVVVDELDFVEAKGDTNPSSAPVDNGFTPIDEMLPFA